MTEWPSVRFRDAGTRGRRGGGGGGEGEGGTPSRRAQCVAERGTKVGISRREKHHRGTATTFYLPLFPRARAINPVMRGSFPASERAGDRLLHISSKSSRLACLISSRLRTRDLTMLANGRVTGNRELVFT
jgi:hypothetical protein